MDPRLDGFRASLAELLPHVRVRSGRGPWGLVVDRPHWGLTDDERRLLALVPATLRELERPGTAAALALQHAGRIGFGDLLVARSLAPAGPFESLPALSLFAALQDLSYRYYEDKHCSSGFYFTENLPGFLAQVDQTTFQFQAFDEPVPFRPEVFRSPASFRYVDGRNSYYVVDGSLHLAGVIRLKEPDRYSLLARLQNQHLRSLLIDRPGRPWVAFVGLREEMFVVVDPDRQWRWSHNHWRFRDRTLLHRVLDRHGVATTLQPLLVSVLYALAEGGIGALLLLPDDPGRVPRTVGTIDRTDLGSHLRAMLRRSSLRDLAATNSLLGILGSDGLTTLSKEGLLLSCGDIIDLGSSADRDTQGGGRSQAGWAASFYGLTIKISQNGPMTFWFQGQVVLQT